VERPKDGVSAVEIDRFEKARAEKHLARLEIELDVVVRVSLGKLPEEERTAWIARLHSALQEGATEAS
jgi:hypothetical protein